MLDLMRKHTRSWLIKLVFAVIILVFIFFFGYSRMQKGQKGSASIAARVNGTVIPYGRYKLALEEAREFYAKLFSDKIPEEVWPQIRSSALYKVINQTLLAQLADKLGISVTPEELYDTISHTPSFQEDGEFDPIAYKRRVLPYFEQRYGLNYEDVLKQDILTAKVVNFLTDHISVPGKEAEEEYKKEKTTWTFDRIRVKAEGEGDMEGEQIALKIIEAINSGSDKKTDQVIKKYGLQKERYNKITIGKRSQILPTDPENESLAAVFSLTKESPTPPLPVKSDTSLYVFRLVELQEPSLSDWEKEREEFTARLTERRKEDYLMDWQENLRQKARIEEYILGDGK